MNHYQVTQFHLFLTDQPFNIDILEIRVNHSCSYKELYHRNLYVENSFISHFALTILKIFCIAIKEL